MKVLVIHITLHSSCVLEHTLLNAALYWTNQYKSSPHAWTLRPVCVNMLVSVTTKECVKPTRRWRTWPVWSTRGRGGWRALTLSRTGRRPSCTGRWGHTADLHCCLSCTSARVTQAAVPCFHSLVGVLEKKTNAAEKHVHHSRLVSWQYIFLANSVSFIHDQVRTFNTLQYI